MAEVNTQLSDASIRAVDGVGLTCISDDAVDLDQQIASESSLIKDANCIQGDISVDIAVVSGIKTTIAIEEVKACATGEYVVVGITDDEVIVNGTDDVIEVENSELERSNTRSADSNFKSVGVKIHKECCIACCIQ